MEQREILLALQEMPGIGWKTQLKLVSGTDNLSGLQEYSADGLTGLGLQQQQAETVVRMLNQTAVEQMQLNHRNLGIRAITIFDQEYPELLKKTSQPPWVLYAKGQVKLLQHPAISVVGTRNPTVYGKRVAEELSESLSAAGMCVVSGLARGIDGMAHQGALKAKGGTIAVLGCGVDVIYPKENADLYRDIAGQGLLLSEFPPGQAALPGLFPLRNRIIAGLSFGTVVVEAALRSGSLITADQAMEESRDVFAVPGPITSPKSQGVLSLIKQGAKLVTEVGDILQEYSAWLPEGYSASPGTAVSSSIELSNEEREILNLIACEPVTIDSLLERSQTNFGHLHAILLSLLLKKRIQQLPGAAYAAIN